MISIDDFDLEKPIMYLLASESVAGAGSKKLYARIRLNNEPISFCVYSGDSMQYACPSFEEAIDEYNHTELSSKKWSKDDEET